MDAPDHDVVTGALHALAEPWAAVTPVAQAALTRVVERAEEDGGRDGSGYEGPGGNGKRRSGDPAASVAAALVVAARHGHPAVLWSVAENPAAAPAPRRRAVELLGERAERTDIGRLVELAATDPLLLAGPALACLRALHRRGHFPAERDAGPLLALALADHTLPAHDVATVLYTCRHRMPDRPPLRQTVLDAARVPLGRHPAGVRTGRTRLAFGRICGSDMPLYLRSGPGY
ncbi:hypothetical protein [Streptomyces sp. NRRL F-5702]|uniref:hypothetical protein n=1 Tax=Streptomyces sp. NRRL F-5702 TaxID=1463870 RepID=UPI0004CBEAE1|nr:hypothetical protein [Streptomyces sp. NRRL F-5702]